MMNLVVALKAEARPLIRHYELRHRHANTGFSIYTGTNMALIVSGPGKSAAATATTCLQELTPGSERNAWLNIGIAGHATLATGEGRIANRITEQATNKSWYPPQVHDTGIATDRLLTVDAPENDYTVDSLYDMEAAGFYPAACRYSTSELVQCLKVVSDNKQQANTKITAKYCEQLIDSQMKTIDTLVEKLGIMQQQYNSWHAPHPDLDRLTGQWHFTVSQQHQLARLLDRWTALIPERVVWDRELDSMNTATEVLHCLNQQLNTCP